MIDPLSQLAGAFGKKSTMKKPVFPSLMSSKLVASEIEHNPFCDSGDNVRSNRGTADYKSEEVGIMRSLTLWQRHYMRAEPEDGYQGAD